MIKLVHILHTADFHLDPRMTYFLNKDRQRRRDFLNSFDQIIDFANTERPDLFLISGDIFDSLNPRNPVRNHVIKRFKELYKKKIKIIAISGNHDEPRSIEHGLSPVSILDSIEYLDLLQAEGDFFGKRELVIDNVKINVFGESYNIFCSSTQDPLDFRKFPDINGNINIFMIHASIGLFKYSYAGDFICKEAKIPPEIDYVAAGHLHDHMEKTRANPEKGNSTHLIYPGSIEYLSFKEKLDKPKGFMFFDVNKDGIVNKEFIEIDTRPIRDITIPINSSDNNIYEKIIHQIEGLSDSELILKVLLNGKLKAEQITTIYQNKIIDFGDQNFFKLFLDTYSKLTFETAELILPDRDHITPKEVFNYYIDNLIENVSSEEFAKLLREAKEISLNKLIKFGVE